MGEPVETVREMVERRVRRGEAIIE